MSECKFCKMEKKENKIGDQVFAYTCGEDFRGEEGSDIGISELDQPLNDDSSSKYVLTVYHDNICNWCKILDECIPIKFCPMCGRKLI